MQVQRDLELRMVKIFAHDFIVDDESDESRFPKKFNGRGLGLRFDHA